MILTVKQTKALDYLEDNITTEVLYGGAAGGGKSVLGVYWLLKCCLKYPGTRWVMGRSELRNLKETTLKSFFEVCQKQDIKHGVHFQYFDNPKNYITFANGSEILLKDLCLYPSDPNFDSLGSLEITGAFIDECNQLVERARDIISARIRYKLKEYGLIGKMLLTCNPAKNWVYYNYYQPYNENRLPEYRKFIPALPKDNRENLPADYQERLSKMSTVDKQRLLDGNWEYDDDKTALIEYEKILDCFSNDFDSLGGDVFITCDVARFGSDKTVIGIWNGWRCKLYSFSGLSVKETANTIQGFRKRFNCGTQSVIADEDGVGGGVVDILGCKGFVNNSRPLQNPLNYADENYANLKSQCYFRLAERINKGGLYIECDDIKIKADIIQELEQVKQHNMDKDSKRQVLPKDKVKELIGRSPDFADCLMMREWFELKPVFHILAG